MSFSSRWIEHFGCSQSLDLLGRFEDALIIWNEVGTNGFIWDWLESEEQVLFEKNSNGFVEIFTVESKEQPESSKEPTKEEMPKKTKWSP